MHFSLKTVRNTEVVLNYSTVYRAVVVCVVIHMQ